MNSDKIQLPAIMPGNLPEPAVVAEQYRAAFRSIYTKIEGEIADAEIDLTTKSGREVIASRAYKIARTKIGLQKAAKSLTEEQQAIINVVNAETKTMRETLDGLRDKARAPLNKWEDAEARRIEGLEEGLDHLRNLAQIDSTYSPDEIQEWIDGIHGCFNSGDWGTYQPMADAAHEAAITKFTADLAASERHIADEKELTELRELKAEQQRKAEAERVEFERKALADKLEQARQEEAERAAQQERERQHLANERAKQDAAGRVQAEQDRADKAEAFAKQAEIDRIAAAEKAEKDKIEAAEFAVNEERNRQARIAATEREAKEEREADLAHRKTINNAALAAMVTCSEISTEQAKMIVQAMAKGHIPHVTILY